MLRDIAEGIADFIREDEPLRAGGNVSVVVEDKADVAFEVQRAIGGLGVLVLVSVVGFRRTDRAPVAQGSLQFQISCFENPSLNREGPAAPTAQGVAERLAKILHDRRFPFLVGQLLLTDFSRDDIEEANIVRGNYEANTLLGYEDGYFHPATDSTGGDEQHQPNEQGKE